VIFKLFMALAAQHVFHIFILTTAITVIRNRLWET